MASVAETITITVLSTVELVRLTNVWRYDQSAANLSNAWKETAFNDTAWPSGAALLFNETAVLPGPTNTLLSLTNAAGARVITYYFRTHFTLPGDPSGVTLVASNLIDDGAVFYLNGVEAGRYNMTNGPFNNGTFSVVSISDATTYVVTSLSAAGLVAGDNALD